MKFTHKLLCTIIALCTARTITPMSKIAGKLGGPLYGNLKFRNLNLIGRRFKGTSKDTGNPRGPHHPGPRKTFKQRHNKFKQQPFGGKWFGNRGKQQLKFEPQFNKQETIKPDKIFMPKHKKPKLHIDEPSIVQGRVISVKSIPGPMAQLRGWWYDSVRPQTQNILRGAKRWGQSIVNIGRQAPSQLRQAGKDFQGWLTKDFDKNRRFIQETRKFVAKKYPHISLDKLVELEVSLALLEAIMPMAKSTEIITKLGATVAGLGLTNVTANLLFNDLKKLYNNKIRTAEEKEKAEQQIEYFGSPY